MAKVTVIGAGNVGATCANILAFNRVVSEVVMLDVVEGIAEGKAIDMLQTTQTIGFETKITGVTNDYSKTADSEVIIITSGIPRRPGMTREELIGTNAKVVRGVVDNCLFYSPSAIFVIVTNPMDTMTYLALKASGLPKNRVIGMGGLLDSSRFKYHLCKALDANTRQIDGIVIGGHGDTTMIPLKRLAKFNCIPVSELLSPEALDKVVADTMTSGATLTRLLGTSAWYAPGAAAAYVAQSIVGNYKRLIASSVYLEGEFGQEDICIGVPAIVGMYGAEKILPLELNDEEKDQFARSSDAVRSTNQVLKEINVL